jgi:uncharacterized protein YdiU (UPF0061 family)
MPQYQAHYLQRMRRKLGLGTAEEGDGTLLAALLSAMHAGHADFTLTFRRLADALEPAGEAALRALFRDSAALDAWLADWHARLAREAQPVAQRRAAMLRVNPAYIPRNHRVETALAAAAERGDMAPFDTLLRLLQQPFDPHPGFEPFQLPPQPEERVLMTFCGT